MNKKILLFSLAILLIFNLARGQEKPAFHITTITVSPNDSDPFKKQLQQLIVIFESEKFGSASMIGTYRTDNKWAFVSLRPMSSLFGIADSAVLEALKDSSTVHHYKNVSHSLKQLDLNVKRRVIQQVNEWSYAPEGTPEHDQFAIIQEWTLKPGRKDFDSLMQDLVAWAKQTDYPYVFDTYYTVEQPWKVTFVTWVDSLDTYFNNHTLGALNNANIEVSKLRDRLHAMLIDFETEVNLMMPEYSYFPK